MFKGLEALHKNNLIHRDIKPANIGLSGSAPPTVKLIDFGLAKEVGASLTTNAATMAGTPIYMAPEVLSGYYSAPVDVWSAAVTMGVLMRRKEPLGMLQLEHQISAFVSSVVSSAKRVI